MKIGLFGGTFDPVHNGHIALAKSAIEQVPLDRLIVIPAKIQPFKTHQEVTSGDHRINMLKLAFQDVPKAEISEYEVDKSGISYTVDTLNHFREVYPEESLFFLLGSDAFLRIMDWKDSEFILSNFAFVVGGRPGYMEKDLLEVANRVKATYNTEVILLKNKLIKQQSTEIRTLAENRVSLSTNVPEKVAEYIVREGLYLNEDIREFIQHNYSPRLKEHTIQVEATAVDLGKIYGGDINKIRTAALFHDIGRGLDMEALNEYIDFFDLEPRYLDNKNLSHSKVGAKLMERDFGIKDQEILDAVSYHTTGRKGMTLLEKILYLADAIEPNRDYPGVEELRGRAFEDLDRALLMALDQSISFVEEKGYALDKDTIEAKNDIINSIKEDLNG